MSARERTVKQVELMEKGIIKDQMDCNTTILLFQENNYNTAYTFYFYNMTSVSLISQSLFI